MSHTPEPWRITELDRVIADCMEKVNDDYFIADCFGPDAKANARRIVACVNFCAEVSIEKLESSRCGEYQQVLLKERDTYRDLCVGLLAFANTVKEYAEKYPHDTGLYDLVVCEIKKLEQLK